jgi:hypothetical protein
MQFTSWSTLKNTLFFSTIAMLSLTPAANATVFLDFTHPAHGTVYTIGHSYRLEWYVPKKGKASGKSRWVFDGGYCRFIITTDRENVSGKSGTLYLVNEVLEVYCACHGI